MKRKPEDGAEEKELVLDTEDEATPSAMVEAEAKAGEPEAAATPEAAAGLEGQTLPSAAEADPLAQFRPDGPDQIAAGDEAPEGAPASPQPDDALAPDLFDIFREAKNEVEESTLASEMPDIPIEELLGDLVSISRRLGVSPQARAKRDPPSSHELREDDK
jgi:hypothetical protein